LIYLEFETSRLDARSQHAAVRWALTIFHAVEGARLPQKG